MTVTHRRILLTTLLTLVVMVGGARGATSQNGDGTAANDAGIPKETVVMLHGFGRGKSAMWLLALRLEEGGYHVVRIGYDSLQETPEQMLQEVSGQINACCAAELHPVHFVGHSLGGLLIRAYLARNTVRNLGRVVLIGTPNNGTPVVDRNRDKWWMKLAGPSALSLGTDENSFPRSLPPPTYPVGVIAGVVDRIENDQVVAGTDDGVVPVESTKLDGMTDFLLLHSGHVMLRYDRDVARQTIEFLKHGRFAQ